MSDNSDALNSSSSPLVTPVSSAVPEGALEGCADQVGVPCVSSQAGMAAALWAPLTAGVFFATGGGTFFVWGALDTTGGGVALVMLGAASDGLLGPSETTSSFSEARFRAASFAAISCKQRRGEPHMSRSRGGNTKAKNKAGRSSTHAHHIWCSRGCTTAVAATWLLL